MRPMIQYIKNNNNESLTGVEVGVWDGSNALSIIKNLNIEILFLVDPWKHHHIHNNRFFSQDKMDIVLMMAVARLMPYEDSWRIIRKSSCKAIAHVPSNLDFVYIDAIHTYRQIKKDISAWYSKVKSGGVFGGHDYSSETPGVITGVDEFVDKNNLDLNVEELDWWIIKKLKLKQ